MNDYKGIYETTGNADNVAQLSNIINNNHGFEITVQDHAPDIVDLGTKQGFELVNNVAGLLEYEPEITIPIMLEHGKNGATVLAINDENYINAYNNNDTTTISQMYEEADEINQFIDNNFVLK